MLLYSCSLRWHYPNQVQGSKGTPSSQPVCKLPVIQLQTKNRRHPPDASCKNHACDDFLRRHYPHQVKGSKFDYFLSACFTSSPVFVCWVYYIPADKFAQLTIRTKMMLGFVEIAQMQFPTPTEAAMSTPAPALRFLPEDGITLEHTSKNHPRLIRTQGDNRHSEKDVVQ